MFLQEIIQNIIPFYLMIVNYDKKNGWSSVFDGGINSLFKGNLNESDASFVKNIKTIQNSLGTISSKNIDRLANSIGGVSTELVDSAKAVRSGKQSWADFDNTVVSVTKSTSKFSSFTSKAGTALKSFGSSVLSMGVNMLAGMAIGAAISGVITLIDDYIHRNERLIEAGEEAKSSIESTFNEFTDSKSSITDLGKSLSDNADEIITTGDAIDTLAEKYTKLRDGVSSVDNSNKFLSDEDYQSYLDISNQIAEQFPSLVSGYDAQGNAILNLGNNASTAASQLTELYNASMLSANVEIGNQLNDRYSGVEAQIKEYQNEINDWQNTIDKNDEKIASIDLEPTDITDGIIKFDPNAFGKETTKVRKEINDILNKHGITNRENILEDGTIQINTSGINDVTAQEIKDVIDTYGEDAIDALNIDNAEYEQKIAANKQLIQDQWDSMAESVGQYLQTSPSFSELDSTLQNAFLGNIGELDVSQIGSEYGGDVQQFLYSEILNPLTDMKPEAQQKLADLIQLDPSNMSIDEYSGAVSKALYNAFPNDTEMQDQMRKTFGFEKVAEEAEHQADALKETLGDDFSDAIDAMSLDELEKGYDLVINGDEAISTVDQLQEKIKQTQALAATAVDLNVSAQMDAIESALQSENAGTDYENAVGYLEKAKDLFDEGLIGTDDFKSIAAYLSPTGSDDAVNFAENYGKALRYLTEDGKGVQNFLDDLEKKGYATMETLSDGTQNWAFDIEDLEDAASNMGIGFEFMMDMFGRLEDYGFHNNFVGSVEDGTQRIVDLSTQLAQEEAKLAQLQAEGANTTAIEQQQEKVNALKNDINETSDALEQLISRSAEDYNEQINESKEAIKTLKDERQKILDEDTFGENTNLVADKLEEQIRQIAAEAGLELDAELNIVNKDEALDDVKLDFSVDLSQLDDLKSKAQESLSSVQEMVSEISTVDINLDSLDVDDINSQISAVQSVLYGLRNEDGTIDIETEGVQDAINVLNALYAQKEAVSGSVIMSVDTSGLDSDVGAVITKLQEFHQAYSELERLNTLSSAGISVDTSDAQAKLDGIVSEIQGLDGKQAEIMAKVVPDTSSVSSITSSLAGITPEILVKAGVDESAIVAYNPSDKDASVKYKVDSAAVNAWQAPDKSATLTYNITTSGALPGNKTRTLTYNIETNGSAPHQGTAHASGTAVKSYRFNNWRGQANVSGNWGVRQGGTSLVGELGQEILVRGSEFHTIGDNGAEFIQTRPGDIIFNHKIIFVAIY